MRLTRRGRTDRRFGRAGLVLRRLGRAGSGRVAASTVNGLALGRGGRILVAGSVRNDALGSPQGGVDYGWVAGLRG